MIVWRVLCMVGIAIFLSACSIIGNALVSKSYKLSFVLEEGIPLVSIPELYSNPTKYLGKLIRVSGRVAKGERLGEPVMLGKSGFYLERQEDLPPIDHEIELKGYLKRRSGNLYLSPAEFSFDNLTHEEMADRLRRLGRRKPDSQ